MATYVILSTIETEGFDEPADFTERAEKVKKKIKSECPNVNWKLSFALTGYYDVLDIVEAENPEDVKKASMIIRIHGHGHTETFAATRWDDFIGALK